MIEYDDANAMEQSDDMLSISFLNALEYCPRRFYYECVLSEFLDNAHTIEGTMRHEMSDSGVTTTRNGVTTLRRVWVHSTRLRLSGFADIVEETEGHLTPIEYKKGKMGEWLNDHVQLCAQALCLEEMTQRTIERGSIFYVNSAHREEVLFTEQLRHHTEETIRLAFTLIEQQTLPAPLVGKVTRRSPLPSMHAKCRDCSLEPLCLPREVWLMEQSKNGEKGL